MYESEEDDSRNDHNFTCVLDQRVTMPIAISLFHKKIIEFEKLDWIEPDGQKQRINC